MNPRRVGLWMMSGARRTRAGRALALACAIGVVGALVATSGCYRRVIRSEGLGADQHNVQEPYQEDYLIDDVLFGEDTSGKKREPKER